MGQRQRNAACALCGTGAAVSGFKKGKMLYYLRESPLFSMAAFCVLAAGLVCLPVTFIGEAFGAEGTLAEIVSAAVSRTVYFAVFLALLGATGFGPAHTGRSAGGGLRTFFLVLPAFIVALDNLPFLELLSGVAGVDASGALIASFAAECVAVAAFEETAFRGVIYPLALQGCGTDRKGRVEGVLLGGALFGAMHLLNLTGGVSGAVFLQAGYSFLIGAMLCVLMFCGAPLSACVAVHALYNFCGKLVDTLGSGTQWDLPRVLITAVVGICAAVFYVVALWREKAETGAALSAVNLRERLYSRL